MAEQTDNKKQEEQKKKVPVKTIAVIALVLLVEIGGVAIAYWLGGGPAEVKADGAALDAAALADQPVEVMVVEEKFQNTRTGRPYVYDTVIYAVIRQKHQDQIEKRLENMQAQINTRIATIFRRAEPAHLLEPELATLTRQIKAAMDEEFGVDEDGKPYVQKVLIQKCMQFRADL